MLAFRHAQWRMPVAIPGVRRVADNRTAQVRMQ